LLEKLRKYDLRHEAKVFIVQALLGFILWTAILTPYMIYGVKVNLEQYLNWVIMELVLVPPVAPFIVRITNYLVKKVLKQ